MIFLHTQKYSGFTLIELLIVIAIIAILASVILSNIFSAREHAIVGNLKQSMDSIRSGAELCANETGFIDAGLHNVGDSICAGSSVTYPSLDGSCGSLMFMATNGSNPYEWSVTTNGYCAGCRLTCTVESCRVAAEESSGACDM